MNNINTLARKIVMLVPRYIVEKKKENNDDAVRFSILEVLMTARIKGTFMLQVS